MLSLFPHASKSTDDKNRREQHQMTPLFSRKVDAVLSSSSHHKDEGGAPYTQYGLLGLREEERMSPITETTLQDDLVFANMNTPWSAFICGSQGAGKSHTLSCLLENALFRSNQLGKLPDPLTGIVFHYDKFSSATTTQVCEAAYLCSSGIPVTVLVSPSNIWAMNRMYTNLPGLKTFENKPKVVPLYLTEKQLDITRILKLMAIDPSSKDHPLYMEIVVNLLREMAMEGNPGGFSYSGFRRRLEGTQWQAMQSQPLNLRLSLLESFMVPSATTKSTRPAASTEDIWAFPQGSLTIVDLSDPFVNQDDACAFFSICLSIFLESRGTCGRVVALDEAHKFLIQSGEALELTESLTSVIREQRHTGTRVFIATQEPTLSPQLIDLANVTIIHRFSSPAWYNVLKDHLAGIRKHQYQQRQQKEDRDDLFETIVNLETGQALVFCPTALLDIDSIDPMNPELPGQATTKILGSGYAKLRIRSRLTADGGKSVLASNTTSSLSPQPSSIFASSTSSLFPSSSSDTNTAIPMHVVKGLKSMQEKASGSVRSKKQRL